MEHCVCLSIVPKYVKRNRRDNSYRTNSCFYVHSQTHPDPFPVCYFARRRGVSKSIIENVLFVAEYAQKWEQLLVQQRDILNAAIDQVSQFRGQLLQEEQISQKMTRTRNLRYN